MSFNNHTTMVASKMISFKNNITNKILLSFLIFSLVFSLTQSMGAETIETDINLSLNEGMQDLKLQYENYLPILIENDIDIIGYAEGFQGTGSESDPYIIEGYSISSSGAYAISISGLSEDIHFIIRDCWINVSSAYGTGIKIANVSEEAFIIENNLIVNASIGIEIVNASSTTLVNNTCQNIDLYGIQIINSNYSYLENNICKDAKQGIVIASSNSVQVHENQLIKNSVYGINVTSSNHGIITNNYITENNRGMRISGDNNTMTGNIFYLNTQSPQAADYGTSSWSSLEIGNYWSDYTGTGDYTLEDGVAKDSFPMTIAELDTDYDNDGILDGWELTYNLDIFNATDAQTDLDSDGLSNLDEFLNETDPSDEDSDGDGMKDGDEVKYGYDPLNDSSNQERFDMIVLSIMIVLFLFLVGVTMLFAEYQAK